MTQIFESVIMEKCQNSFLCRVGKCPNRTVSELESVGIGKCQNGKVSALESVWNAENKKFSEFFQSGKSETAWIAKCQKWKCQKMLRLEIVRNSSDWKESEFAQIGKCLKLLRLWSVRVGKCQKLENWKLENVKNYLYWKMSEVAQVGKCQNRKF